MNANCLCIQFLAHEIWTTNRLKSPCNRGGLKEVLKVELEEEMRLEVPSSLNGLAKRETVLARGFLGAERREPLAVEMPQGAKAEV